jgi:hypothetical protein
MDQSRGKPLPERISQEMTSSYPAPSRSLRAPEVGTQRPGGGGGGGNGLALTRGSPIHSFVSWIAEEEDKTFGCDLNSKFSFIIIKENLVKKSKLNVT